MYFVSYHSVGIIKQLRLAAAALALLAVSPCAWAQGWREYVYAADEFAIQFPAPPRIEEHRGLSADGEPMVERIYTTDASGIRYRVTVAQLDDINIAREVEARLALIRQNRPVLVEATDLNICGELGEAVTVETPQGARHAGFVFHLFGRFYTVETITPAALLGSGAPSRFQVSFRHLQMGKEAEPSYFGDGC